jgi:class 3 adenylate cyclase
VHIAARVLALAAPGEILVSRTVTDLVVGTGISFVDRGRAAIAGRTAAVADLLSRAVTSVGPLRLHASGCPVPLVLSA